MANEALLELRKRVKESSQKEVAKILKVTPQYICDVLKGRRDMSPQLAGRLGFKVVTQYVRTKETQR